MAEFWHRATVPQLEARRSCQQISCYRPHTHDALSIGAIDDGMSVLTGSLDGSIQLRPGDVVVIPAAHVHACNPDAGRWRYQMIHLDQGWAARFLDGAEASRLLAGIAVLRRPDLHRRISRLNDAIFADQGPERLEAEIAAVLAQLEAAAPQFLVAGRADPQLVARLHPVLERLRHDEVNPALTELAAMVGMTKFQLIRAMRRATGLSPLAWRQNARIQRARQLLREGRAIAETAHALGFTDQSHFHRVFRAHVAASPGGYRG